MHPADEQALLSLRRLVDRVYYKHEATVKPQEPLPPLETVNTSGMTIPFPENLLQDLDRLIDLEELRHRELSGMHTEEDGRSSFGLALPKALPRGQFVEYVKGKHIVKSMPGTQSFSHDMTGAMEGDDDPFDSDGDDVYINPNVEQKKKQQQQQQKQVTYADPVKQELDSWITSALIGLKEGTDLTELTESLFNRIDELGDRVEFLALASLLKKTGWDSRKVCFRVLDEQQLSNGLRLLSTKLREGGSGSQHRSNLAPPRKVRTNDAPGFLEGGMHEKSGHEYTDFATRRDRRVSDWLGSKTLSAHKRKSGAKLVDGYELELADSKIKRKRKAPRRGPQAVARALALAKKKRASGLKLRKKKRKKTPKNQRQGEATFLSAPQVTGGAKTHKEAEYLLFAYLIEQEEKLLEDVESSDESGEYDGDSSEFSSDDEEEEEGGEDTASRVRSKKKKKKKKKKRRHKRIKKEQIERKTSPWIFYENLLANLEQILVLDENLDDFHAILLQHMPLEGNKSELAYNAIKMLFLEKAATQVSTTSTSAPQPEQPAEQQQQQQKKKEGEGEEEEGADVWNASTEMESFFERLEGQVELLGDAVKDRGSIHTRLMGKAPYEQVATCDSITCNEKSSYLLSICTKCGSSDTLSFPLADHVQHLVRDKRKRLKKPPNSVQPPTISQAAVPTAVTAVVTQQPDNDDLAADLEAALDAEMTGDAAGNDDAQPEEVKMLMKDEASDDVFIPTAPPSLMRQLTEVETATAPQDAPVDTAASVLPASSSSSSSSSGSSTEKALTTTAMDTSDDAPLVSTSESVGKHGRVLVPLHEIQLKKGGNLTRNDSRQKKSVLVPSTAEIARLETYMNETTMLSLRNECCVRACTYIDKLFKNNAAFHQHSGDIIFLLRNAITRCPDSGVLHHAAKSVVYGLLERWDESRLSVLPEYSESDHVLGYAECLHAKLELQWKNPKLSSLEQQRKDLEKALLKQSVDDIIRFDAANSVEVPLTDAGYCIRCGKFQKLSLTKCPNDKCGRSLQQMNDFEAMFEALVWTSVFQDIGIDPLITADASVTVQDVLKLLPDVRPYRNLMELGVDSFGDQCYFVTHFLFILSKWGAVHLSPARYFLEELIFLLNNMDVVIKLNDPELVGEFVYSLRLLGVSEDNVAIQKGTVYLLEVERRRGEGSWLGSSVTVFKKYHAAYVGIIGLMDFEFDDKPLTEEWKRYLNGSVRIVVEDDDDDSSDSEDDEEMSSEDEDATSDDEEPPEETDHPQENQTSTAMDVDDALDTMM